MPSVKLKSRALLDLKVMLTILRFISLHCCFSLSSPSLSSHHCPLLDTNKHGWVDCCQRWQTKSCVNTLAGVPAHHGPLIRWLMASFSAVHPSLLSPSVLTLPLSFLPSLCSPSFTMERRKWSGSGNIAIATAPISNLLQSPLHYNYHLHSHVFLDPPLLLPGIIPIPPCCWPSIS